MNEHQANCYLINTGWSGGRYGQGSRMDIDITRAIIDSIHDGSLEQTEWENFEVFNMAIPTKVPGVDSQVLHPRKTWADNDDFDRTLRHLAEEFQQNFRKYSDQASQNIRNAGPKV